MPRFDGNGPVSGTGRGFGFGYNAGFGCRRGLGLGIGRGFFGRRPCIRTDAERLEALSDYKKALEEELLEITKAENDLRKAA